MLEESSSPLKSSMRKTRYKGRMATPSDSDDEVQVVTPLKAVSHSVQDKIPAYTFIDFRYDLPFTEENLQWLEIVGLMDFARLPWATWRQNKMGTVYLAQLQLNDGNVFGDYYLTEELVADVFDLPTAEDNEVGKATEKAMARAFGPSQGDRHYYQFSGMKDQGKLQSR